MIRRQTVFWALILAMAAATASPATSQTTPVSVFPGQEWEYVRGAELLTYGWSPEGLRHAFEFVRDSANSTGIVVVDRGKIVFQFGDIQELSYLASVRKSVLAMLYGKYIEDGTIDLEVTLLELGMDDEGGLLEVEKQASVHHLITARSGVYHPASNAGDDLAWAPARGTQQPGTYMLYSNWDFNAAGGAFELMTGRDIYDELGAQLAIPLQFQDWDRGVQRKTGNLVASRYPAYHMHLSTRDMARIGYLMLHEGSWNGHQVIPGDWARRIVSLVTPLEEMNPPRRREGYFGYGYMWWIWDGPRAVGPFQGTYTARGAVGQWITVFPSLDLVIAHKTHNIYQRTTSWASWERFIELIFEAKGVQIEDPYPWR